MKKKTRISKENYYMNIAREVASRATCFRMHHGAIIVKDDQIIATGYNGAPRKTKDCLERDNCLRNELGILSGQRYEICRSVHSEQNAIINAARAGVSLLGGTIYLYSVRINEKGDESIIDALPCFICKKMIINSGVEFLIACRKNGKLKKYAIKDWVSDWSKKDLIDDKEQYGVKTVKSNS